MALLDFSDLDNGKKDLDHIAALATSPALTARDRNGNEKKTWAGIEAELGAAAAITQTGQNRAATEAAAASLSDRVYLTVYTTPPLAKPISGLPCAEGDTCFILTDGSPRRFAYVDGEWTIEIADGLALGGDIGGTLVKQVFFVGADRRELASKMRDQGVHLFDLVTDETEQNAIRDGISALDLTDTIADALDLIGNYSQGGTFRLPCGVTNSGPLYLPPKIALLGPQPPGFQERALVASMSGAILRPLPGVQAPLLRNSDSGYVRNSASEVDGLPQHYSNAVIKNITLAQSEDASDARATLLELERCWNVHLENVNFNGKYRGGFVFKALDCNTLRVRNCNAIGAVYFESVADTQWLGGEIGAVQGRAWPSLWVTGATWQTVFNGLFVYNNALNAAAPVWSWTFSGSTITLDAVDHWLQDETPVVVNTTGALPTGLALGITYYVKRLSSTQIALATSRRRVRLGLYITLADGVGVHAIQVGANANIYINGGTHETVFSAIRSDQAYGSAIIFDASHRNTVSGLLANQCGLGNSTGQAAIQLLNGASCNTVSSGVINGAASETGPGNQTIGIYEDASSAGRNHFGDALVVKGHSAGNYVSPKYVGEVHSIAVPIGSFTALAGSPAIGNVGGNRGVGWMFDATADEVIAGSIQVPVGWSRLRIGLRWTNAGAGSGDVLWTANVGHFGVGDTLDLQSQGTASVNINADAATAGAKDVVVFSRLDIVSTFRAVPGEVLRLQIKRVGSDAKDTLLNDAALLAVTLERLDD